MVEYGAFSHKIDILTIFKEILNLKGHLNHITGSRIMAILLNGLTLPLVLELHCIGGGSAINKGYHV